MSTSVVIAPRLVQFSTSANRYAVADRASRTACLQYLVDKLITHVLLRPAEDAEDTDSRPMSPLQDALLAPSNQSTGTILEESQQSLDPNEAGSTKVRAVLDAKLLALLAPPEVIHDPESSQSSQSTRDASFIQESDDEEGYEPDVRRALMSLLEQLGDAAAAQKRL